MTTGRWAKNNSIGQSIRKGGNHLLMVLKKERVLKTCLDALSFLKSSCEGRGKAGLFDLHTIAESFFCPFLNEMYGLNLTAFEKGHPGIDLGDDAAGISYQITADGSTPKIQHTLNTCKKHKLFTKYPNLRIVIIGKRQKSYSLSIPRDASFDPKSDVVDVHGLGEVVRKLKTPHIERLADIAASEFEGFGNKEASSPFLPIDVSINGGSVHVPDASCTFAFEAGWSAELVVHNVSSEVIEPDDFSISWIMPLKLFIRDERMKETPKLSFPIRMGKSKALWEMTHFDRLLPGARRMYPINLQVSSEGRVKIGDGINTVVQVHTKRGNADYQFRIDMVSDEDHMAAVRKRKKKASSGTNERGVAALITFIQTLETDKKNLPPVSWKRTFAAVDPECESLTKVDIIRRLFSTSNHEDLAAFLGNVKGLYAVPLRRREVRISFEKVCEAFNVDFSELV